MSNKVRVRVELSKKSSSYEKALAKLRRDFKKACDDYGISHSYKEHEFFVRKTDKRRRKEARQRQMRQAASRGELKDFEYDGEQENGFRWNGRF